MFRGSIRLFRLGGIQISIHFTFLLLLAYVGWDGWREGGFGAGLMDVATMLVSFVCVLLHELGHAFTARSFGVEVPRILLMPIGSMAEFASVPKKPAQEILIALAGPAVNFAIIGVLLLFSPIPSWFRVRELQLTFLQLILVMNLVMGTFNLLPAFPMDGGRVFRAILAQYIPYIKATKWAAHVGKALAAMGMLAAIFISHNLLTAALFLFIMFAGEMEYQAVLRQDREDRLNAVFQVNDKNEQPPALLL